MRLTDLWNLIPVVKLLQLRQAIIITVLEDAVESYTDDKYLMQFPLLNSKPKYLTLTFLKQNVNDLFIGSYSFYLVT